MSMTHDNGRDFWTRKEIADYLRLTEKTIDNFRRRGLLPAHCLAGRSVRFKRDDVLALVATRRT
jgi:excisionase family DNA binding protein